MVNGTNNGVTPRLGRRMTQADLEAFLEKAADTLRGNVDHSEFRGYVFALLFFKRISDLFQEAVRRLAKDVGDELARDPLMQKKALPFGLFLVVLNLYSYVDAVMLGVMRTDVETGLYTAAYRVYEGLTYAPAVIAAVLTPPDVLSQASLAIPLLALYEGSILAVRMVEKKAATATATGTPPAAAPPPPQANPAE